jgi:DNA-binding MurR/RpiR family transcriptional regulator
MARSSVGSEAKVAKVIMDGPSKAVYSSVSAVADRAETSASAVVRACQKLGFRGFQDLKVALAQELALLDAASVGSVDRDDVLTTVLSSSASALQETIRTVDRQAFGRAVSALGDAECVLVVGAGASSGPAYDGAYRLAAIGVRAEYRAEIMAQHLAASRLGKGDALLAVSYTGATRETMAAAEAAAVNGATVIAITSFVPSPLTEVADIVLLAGAPEAGFRLEAVSSRVAHMAVLDALYVAVARAKPERAERALNSMAEVTAHHSY